VFLLVVVLYFAALATIGILSARSNRSLADFLLAGRGLGRVTTAVSAGASDMSAWLLLGFPGFVYANGFSALWVALGLIIGTFGNWYLVARRLRVDSEKHNALTLPDYLESRFPGRGFQWIRLLATAVILVFFTVYISAQFSAAGMTFQQVTEINPLGGRTFDFGTGVLIGAFIVLLYTMLGGFLAVSLTDVLQGFLMLVALVVVPVIAIWDLGGIGGAIRALGEAGGAGLMLSVTGGKPFGSFLLGLLLPGLAWGLGYPGQPHILARFMAIKRPRQIPEAGLLGVSWVVITLYGAMLVGLLAHASLPGYTGNDELVLLQMAMTMLPGFLAAIVVSAALAGMMSTADSQLLVISSSVVQDVLIKVFKVRVGERGGVTLSRIVVVLVVVAAAAKSLASDKSVYITVSDAWYGLGAGIGPAVIFALWAPWARRWGIIAGMLTGLLVVFTWDKWPVVSGMETKPPVLLPAFILACLAITVVSLGKALISRRR